MTDFQYLITENQYLNAEKCLRNQNTEIQYLNSPNTDFHNLKIKYKM